MFSPVLGLSGNITNKQMENSNEKNGCSCMSKPLAIIAIVLSVISILFSTFTLITTRGRHRRDFHMQRPYNAQSEMRGGCPNNNCYKFGDRQFNMPNNQQFGQMPNMPDNQNNFNFPNDNRHQFNGRNFDKPNNSNNNNSNQPNNNGPTTAPSVSP